jgi:alkylation response protein AidB-like acyl-CoA dehydrogenase
MPSALSTSSDEEFFADAPIATAHALASRLAESAVERDRTGGHAAREREWIRESGLLTLSIPAEFGGQGASWSTVYQVIRILARSDSALAHVFAFHHLQLAGVEISSQLFELTGARSTSAKYGFDRYWRNVRVHTLHDPIDYKYRDLGRYALQGTLPEPTAYS